MKKRFTEEQIIQILKEQEAGERTSDVCRRHGVSQPTLGKIPIKNGGLRLGILKIPFQILGRFNVMYA